MKSDRTNIILSWERICYFYKKYWKVVIGSMIIAFLVLGGLIWHNSNSVLKQSEEHVLKHTYIIKEEIEDKVSSVGIVEDCKVLASTDNMISCVNVALKKQEMNERENLSNIQIEMLENSNCFTVTVIGTNDQENKIIMDSAVSYWNEQMNDFYGEMIFLLLDVQNDTSEIEEVPVLIGLKELIIMMLIICSGIAVVYFIIILDDRLVTYTELKSYFCNEKIMYMENESILSLWLENQRGKNIEIIYGRGFEEESERIKNTAIHVVALEANEQFSECAEKYLLIRRGYSKGKDIEILLNKLEIIGKKLTGVFWIEK